MINQLKLRGKMVAIGGVAITALSILFLIVLSSNRMVNRNVTTSTESQEQLHLVERMTNAQLTLLLAAMDAELAG